MGRLNLIQRRLERFQREPPSVRNAAGTVVGCTIALVATYLLWPKDREADKAVPVAGDVATASPG